MTWTDEESKMIFNDLNMFWSLLLWAFLMSCAKVPKSVNTRRMKAFLYVSPQCF